MGLAADGFEISMYFYVKVHFQKNFISENKVHCVLNRARTLTITRYAQFVKELLRVRNNEIYLRDFTMSEIYALLECICVLRDVTL